MAHKSVSSMIRASGALPTSLTQALDGLAALALWALLLKSSFRTSPAWWPSRNATPG